MEISQVLATVSIGPILHTSTWTATSMTPTPSSLLSGAAAGGGTIQ
jgi:hypothetical protein